MHPENLKPGEAKALLRSMSGTADPGSARMSLAEQLDLDVVAKKCNSFASCLEELKAMKL